MHNIDHGNMNANVRPETQAAPEVFYSGHEAQRYTACGQTNRVQEELTRRTLHLAGSPSAPSIILDVGCGSGLSGRVCSQQGLHHIGTDISSDMLDLSLETMSPDCIGLLLSDMGHSLPFRACQGMFDAAISISAVQWLLFKPTGWWEPCVRFFSSLHRALRPGAPAVLQVYIQKEHEALKLLAAARAAGFGPSLPPGLKPLATHTSTQQPHDTSTTSPAAAAADTSRVVEAHDHHTGFASDPGRPDTSMVTCTAGSCCHLVMDFPHLTAAKKYSLVLRKAPQAAAATEHEPHQATSAYKPAAPAPAAAAHAFDTAPECPVAWHIGGTCSLWWSAVRSAHLGLADMLPSPEAAQRGSDEADDLLEGRHAAFAQRQHYDLGRKLGRLLQRAAELPPAQPGLLSPCASGVLPGPGKTHAAALERKGSKKARRGAAPNSAAQQQHGAVDDAVGVGQASNPSSTSTPASAAGGVSPAAPAGPSHRVAATVAAGQWYPCGGHTAVVIMARGQSLCDLFEQQPHHVQQLIARLCDVDETQVHIQQSSTSGLQAAAGEAGDTKPGAQPASGARRKQQGGPGGGSSGGGGAGAAVVNKCDQYLGATLSYHRQVITDTGHKVGVATLQAPGVLPPFAVLDYYQCSPPADLQHPPQHEPVSLLDSSLSCMHSSQELISRASKASSYSSRAAAGQVQAVQAAGQAVPAVYAELGLDEHGRLTCRVLAALFDTCSSMHLPQLLSRALQPDGMQTGASGAGTGPVFKQHMSLLSLTRAMEEYLGPPAPRE